MRQHGTYVCHRFGPDGGSDSTLGCRCPDCSLAATDYERRRRSRTAPPYVDAARARAHAKALMAQGFGLKAQAKAAGVSATMLSKVVYGDPRRGQAPTQRIRPANEKALLGLTLDDAPDSARTVPADRYTATLDELHRRGWTYTQIADRLGVSRSNLKARGARTMVTAGRHRAVLALLDEPVPELTENRGHNAAAIARRDAYDPEAERRDKLRRAAQAEARAHYRAAARGSVEVSVPTLDLAALAAQEWRGTAACRLVPDAERWIFWAPETDDAAMDACRAVCASCRVADQCLASAVANGESGFWGGHTEAERAALSEAAA